MNMKCPKCGYEWKSKVLNPKECPRCKGRLDYAPGPVGAPKVWKKKEVGKEMTSRKLPLAAAAIIIVAAVGAWAILSATTTPTGPGWGYVFGENASFGNSGIVAMYIARENTDLSTDPSTWTEDNYHAKITAQGDMEIPYEENFYIVVEAKGVRPYIAYLVCENIKVELGLTGALSLAPENKTGTQFRWHNVLGDTIRVSADWGPYSLAADQSFNYTAKVWLWY